jgi:hypothetical protein
MGIGQACATDRPKEGRKMKKLLCVIAVLLLLVPSAFAEKNAEYSEIPYIQRSLTMNAIISVLPKGSLIRTKYCEITGAKLRLANEIKGVPGELVCTSEEIETSEIKNMLLAGEYVVSGNNVLYCAGTLMQYGYKGNEQYFSYPLVITKQNDRYGVYIIGCDLVTVDGVEIDGYSLDGWTSWEWYGV